MQTERENKDRAERKKRLLIDWPSGRSDEPPSSTYRSNSSALSPCFCLWSGFNRYIASATLTQVVLASNKCACATCATMEEMGHSPGCTTAAEKESQEELSLPNKNAAGSPPAKRQPTAPQPQSTLKGSSPPSDGGGRLDVLARLEAMAAFDLAPGERVRDLILSEYLEMADIISEFLGTRIFFCV